jgi:protein-tyrosine-phosphatase
LAELGVVGRAAVLDAFAQGEEGSGEGADVPDPFGGGDDYYEEAYRTLEELVGKVLYQMEPILVP